MNPGPAGAVAPVSGDSDELTVMQEVGRLAGRAVQEAAVRLLACRPADLSAVPEDVLAAHVLWLARAASGEDRPAEDVDGATLVLRRRLVDLLRSEILRAWTQQPPQPPIMLETLHALEAAAVACQPEREQSFAVELADRGGMGLVVEVAHDMRSPLTSILFLSEILHRGQSGALNEVQRRQVGIIYSAALGLVGMASDMIEVARGGRHLASTAPQPFSVNDILSSVADLVNPTAEEKGLELRIESLSSAHRIGHPIPLSRVLLNLTTNALKFTHDGSVEVCARAVDGNIVEFSVRDTGPGIAPEALETVYQPFRRQSNRKTGYSFSGTGLGLAICRRLVSAMGAELALESSEGSGTRFSFRLDLPPARTL